MKNTVYRIVKLIYNTDVGFRIKFEKIYKLIKILLLKLIYTYHTHM